MIVLRPIYANAGIRAAYAKRLKKEFARLSNGITYWTIAAYKKQNGRIVQDASPVVSIEDSLRDHIKSWRKKWKEFADKTANWFGTSIDSTTTTAIIAAMRDHGLTVRFDRRRLTNNVTRALIRENVGLIKSIANDYLDSVYGIVMRGMSYGRDVDFIRRELKKRYAITNRRAQLIARDQTHKSAEAIKQARAAGLGITRARWVHVPGVKTSRPTHVRMDGEEYTITDGIYDSAVGYRVRPGELPYCQCTNRWIIPEYGDE